MAIAAMLTAALKTPDDNSHEEIVWNALSLAAAIGAAASFAAPFVSSRLVSTGNV